MCKGICTLYLCGVFFIALKKADRKNMIDIPNGFEPIFRSSPFVDLLGPIYNKKTVDGLTIGLRAEKNTAMREGRCMVVC